MLSMLTRSAALGVALAACPLAPCQGPGLPNPTFSPAEVFTVVSTVGTGSHGRALMIDGYLALPRTGVGVSLYDVSDPYSPSLFSSLSGMGLAEPHTYAQTTRFGGRHVLFVRGSGLGGTGFGIYDFTDSSAPVQRATFTVPGIQGGYATGMFWFFVQGDRLLPGRQPRSVHRRHHGSERAVRQEPHPEERARRLQHGARVGGRQPARPRQQRRRLGLRAL